MAITPTPPGIIQGGMIADTKALSAVIKNLVSKNGLRAGKTVSAAAGADSVVVRVIEVPKMTPAELAETMKWEIERHIPFSANDVELSYQAIDDPATLAADISNPNMEVLLAVARRDMVALHLDTLQGAGLKPVAIDIEDLAVGRSLIDLSKRGLATKNVVVVNIGAALTEVGIFISGVLRFPRMIPLAGENLTRSISDSLGISMEDAEDEKRQNAVILTDMLGQAAAVDDFPYGGGFDEPVTPQATIRTSFDAVNIVVPPPIFGAPAPTTPAPEVDNPFAPSAADNPFANSADNPFVPSATDNPFATASSGGFDIGDDNPFASPQPTSSVPAPEDPRARRQRQIFDAILPVLGELSMELRRSIDYFRSRYPNDTVDQIILCGGSASLAKLDEYFQYEMGIPTVIANPFAGLTVNSKQISSERLNSLAPAFAVAVGLAVRDAVLGAG
jgi:type IV pilus assembly protein PilM